MKPYYITIIDQARGNTQMINMLSFSAPLVAAGALVGYIYNDAAAVVSAQAMIIVFQAIGYGIGAWIRWRRAEGLIG